MRGEEAAEKEPRTSAPLPAVSSCPRMTRGQSPGQDHGGRTQAELPETVCQQPRQLPTLALCRNRQQTPPA